MACRRCSTPPPGLSQPERYRQGGYIKKLPEDPWGHPYLFQAPGRKGAFDVYSLGADGTTGGEKDNADDLFERYLDRHACSTRGAKAPGGGLYAPGDAGRAGDLQLGGAGDRASAGCLGAECVRPPRANDGTGRCPQPHGRATNRSATAIFRQRDRQDGEFRGARGRWRQGRRRCRTIGLAAITIRVEGGPGQSPAIISFVETDAVMKRTSTSVTLFLPLAGRRQGVGGASFRASRPRILARLGPP